MAILLGLPVLAHWPAVIGWLRFDPIYVVSGVAGQTWTTNGLLDGFPGWLDGNAGVTTEALGGLIAWDWLHGILPWWNPYSGVGLPLAAEGQTPAFFLPFVLLLALPHGLLALKIVLMAAAGLFTRALLGRLGCAVVPAVIGAALFELNGTFAWVAHGPMLPVAFLPLALLGLEQAREGRGVPPALALGIAYSLLAGFPETAFIDGLLVAIWACARLAFARDRVRYAARVLAGGLIGIALAAPGVWPFVEALPRSFLGFHAGANTAGLLPDNVALLLFPTVYGNLAAIVVRYGELLTTWYRMGGYCDVALVGLALLGAWPLVRRPPVRDAALRGALVAWLALTIARAASLPGVTAAFNAVPLLGQAAFHLYVVPSWSMALCVLGALALQDRVAGREATARPLLALIPLGAWALWEARGDMMLVWRRLPEYPAFLLGGVAGAGFVLGLIAWLWPRRSARRDAWLAALLVANAALLFLLPLLAGTRGRSVDTASLDFIRADAGIGRVGSLGSLVPNYGALFRVAEIGHNYLPVPRVWVDYVRREFDPGMDGINNYEALPPSSARLPALFAAWRRAGVRAVLTPPGVVTDALAATPAWRGLTLARRGVAMDVWDLPNPTDYFAAPGCDLRVASRTRLVARCPAASALVRLELSWPGWRAWVAGKRVPIATDNIFQRIALPAGRSEVVFAYAPPGIGWAWAACALGALALAASVQRRRSRDGEIRQHLRLPPPA